MKICVDCLNKISQNSTRCKSCSNKFRKGTYKQKNRKPPTRETIIKQVEGRKGYRHSEETKRKISLKNKGKIRTLEFKKRMCEIGKKRKQTQKSKQKMSITMKKKWKEEIYRKKASICKNGVKNPAFNDWSSREPYSIDWSPQLKKEIAKRDGYVCKYCNKLAIGFSGPHHINYNKKDCRPINLIWVHNKCNCKFNTKRDYWIKFWCKKLNISNELLFLENKNVI